MQHHCVSTWITVDACAECSEMIRRDIEDERQMLMAHTMPVPDADPDAEYLQTAHRMPPRRAHESSSTRRVA